MSPDSLSRDLVREAPLLRHDDTVEQAVRAILGSGLPALARGRRDGRLEGIFGDGSS